MTDWDARDYAAQQEWARGAVHPPDDQNVFHVRMMRLEVEASLACN